MTRLLDPFLNLAPAWARRPVLLAALLLLAPAAYWGGRWQQSRVLEHHQFEMEGFHESVARAHATARALGIDTSGWSSTVRVSWDDALNRYLYDHAGQIPPSVKKALSVTYVRVLLHSPGFNRWVEFAFTHSGSLQRYEVSPGYFGRAEPITEAEGARLARTAVEAVWDPAQFPLGEPAVRTAEIGQTGASRRFEWKAKVACCPELIAESHVVMEGARPVQLVAHVYLDPAIEAKRPNRLGTVIGIASWIFIMGPGLFVLYRFARRAMEREVPRRRVFVILGMISLFALVVVILQPFVFMKGATLRNLVSAMRPFLYVVTIMILEVLGILLALAYGATEGDVREWFPGKLTSLDALLSGRIFSANVGVSIVIGSALGAWGFLLVQAASRLVDPRFVGLPGSEIQWSYNPAPWITHLLNALLDALMVVVPALLIPLTVARRVVPRPGWKRTVLMSALAVVAWTLVRLRITDPDVVASTAFMAAALWIAFLTTDLLAAITSQVLILTASSLQVLEVIMPSWDEHMILARGVALLTLVVCLVTSWRGRRYEDRDVRPTYAQNIEQRLMLEAEVSAARQAQLRLLPDEPPAIPGLGLAAFCAPAQGVAGDFFDFFPMSRGRLGLLVADGRTGGLSAALGIALAKGFLHYAAQRDWSPGEAVNGLRELMETGLDDSNDDDPLSIAYLVIDPAAGSVRFARLGQTPRLLSGFDAADSTSELQGLLGPSGIAEGSASLAPGDVLLIFTDAVPQRLAERHPEGIERWLHSKLRLTSGVTAVRLGEALRDALRASEGTAPDDLTAVVVRLERPAAMEGVA